jgi:hypothetical protein
MTHTEDSSMENIMAEQLASLYAEKELLEQELGISDAEDVVTMVRNLIHQLEEFYREGEQV